MGKSGLIQEYKDMGVVWGKKAIDLIRWHNYVFLSLIFPNEVYL